MKESLHVNLATDMVHRHVLLSSRIGNSVSIIVSLSLFEESVNWGSFKRKKQHLYFIIVQHLGNVLIHFLVSSYKTDATLIFLLNK